MHLEDVEGTKGQILFQIEYEQLDNKEVKECLGNRRLMADVRSKMEEVVII